MNESPLWFAFIALGLGFTVIVFIIAYSVDVCKNIEYKSYKKGYEQGLDEGKTIGYRHGEAVGFKRGKTEGYTEGKSFMHTRCLAFLNETLKMVENDEMEIIECIPAKQVVIKS